MKYDEFIKQYGKQKVKFSYYYKYSFTFKNDNGLSVRVGGSSDDIYRFSVDVDKEYFVSELEPNSATLNGENLFDWDW